MFVRDNNLRTIDNIFVNVRITKDYIAILVIVHSLLYINNILRLQCLFQPWTQGLKVLIKWFEKCVKSSNLLNWASGVLKIEANTTWIRRWIFENLRWVIKFFLKITPQRSSSTLGKSKLSPIFCGQLDIVRRVGPVVCELNLHKDWKLHNDFMWVYWVNMCQILTTCSMSFLR